MGKIIRKDLQIDGDVVKRAALRDEQSGFFQNHLLLNGCRCF